MKRVLTLIPIVGIFTTGILVSVPKSASAYCVHNLTGGPIRGYDTARSFGTWGKDLKPDQRDCCPGNNKECQNTTVRIESVQGSKGNGSCEINPGNHGLVEVRYHNYKMVCNVR